MNTFFRPNEATGQLSEDYHQILYKTTVMYKKTVNYFTSLIARYEWRSITVIYWIRLMAVNHSSEQKMPSGLRFCSVDACHHGNAA